MARRYGAHFLRSRIVIIQSVAEQFVVFEEIIVIFEFKIMSTACTLNAIAIIDPCSAVRAEIWWHAGVLIVSNSTAGRLQRNTLHGSGRNGILIVGICNQLAAFR